MADQPLQNSGCPCCKGRGSRCNKLTTFDWLADIPSDLQQKELVEVQFKNTRKEYYRNRDRLDLHRGDYVVVEAESGYDLGMVALVGDLIWEKVRSEQAELQADHAKAVYRIATETDRQRYQEAKGREHRTMIEAREIAASLGLDMKIGDVEYQGDGTRAIFYYIADQRVDFRKLIKILAETFKVRIEMRQIGARQEAGRIGGIGPCGRALCCATWMGRFSTVNTTAARLQDLPLNPLKLTGQCGKLKCCTNYEADVYAEARRQLPPTRTPLETEAGVYYYNKCDLLAGVITYSLHPKQAEGLETISAIRAKEVIEMNKRGEKPEQLSDEEIVAAKPKDILFDSAITRFDKPKERTNKKRKRTKKAATSATAAPRKEEDRRTAPAPNKRPQRDKDRQRPQAAPPSAASEQTAPDSRQEESGQPDTEPSRSSRNRKRSRRPDARRP